MASLYLFCFEWKPASWLLELTEESLRGNRIAEKSCTIENVIKDWIKVYYFVQGAFSRTSQSIFSEISKTFWLLKLKSLVFFYVMVVIMRTFVMVLCQCDLLVSTETFHAYSQTVPFSESILPTFPRQSFFESVLPTFPSTSFLELILPIFCLLVCLFGRPWGKGEEGGWSILPIFGVSPSHYFFPDSPSFFGGQTFPYFWVRLPVFWLSPSHFFLSENFLFYLPYFYLISSSSFYSLWIWLKDAWLDMSTESVFVMRNWFRGDINKIFLCRVYLHWHFRIFKCVSWTPN